MTREDPDDELLDAAARGDAVLVEAALSRGADPEAADERDATALQLACCNGESTAACVRLLVGAGADVNRRNCFGETALISAARNGDGPALLELLKAGADPSVRAEPRALHEGGTALDEAVREGHRGCAEVLAALNMRQCDATGSS